MGDCSLQVIPQDDLDDLMKSCHSNSYDRLEGSVKNIVAAGYSATQCITQVSVWACVSECVRGVSSDT